MLISVFAVDFWQWVAKSCGCVGERYAFFKVNSWVRIIIQVVEFSHRCIIEGSRTVETES